MEDPTLNDLATANNSAYYDDETVPDNYTKLTELSSSDISTYKHNSKPHVIIAHKGTDFSDKNGIRKDVRADLNIALGNKNSDALHKRRTKKTEKIVTALKKSYPDHDIHLTGFSLGGSSASHALATSKIVRDNVKSLNTFNAGSSALVNKPTVTDEIRKELLSKSTHHRIKNDEISAHVKSNLIGKHKEYASKKQPTVQQHLLQMATPLLNRTFAGRLSSFGAKKALDTLQAHSIDNFIKK